MSEHYYTENPTSELRETVFQAEFKGLKLNFTSVSGVFSFEAKIDKASALLANSYYPSCALSSLLDVGCGFGPIGICIKAANPQIEVTMTDINLRAVKYAKYNAELNKLKVEVVSGSLYEALGGRVFGDILSNPPMAAGKAVCSQLIIQASQHMAIGGALWLVCYHNKGGETLKKVMLEEFGNVDDVEKSGGIRVYRSVKSKT